MTKLLQQVHPGRGKEKRQFAALIDLQKAYDTVNREKLWMILYQRCRSEDDKKLLALLIALYGKSIICMGEHSFAADRGVVQGAVLSPMLFNVYLEEALETSQKLKQMRERGDLLAFADDMLLLTNSKVEMETAVKELEGLEGEWSLKLNKTKS